MQPAGVIAELVARVDRFARDRYPVQHATAQFHLGVALLNDGDVERAERALRTAADLFAERPLPVEHAKALNILGAALRARGDAEAAVAAFAEASEAFARCGLGLESGAALFNEGLAHRDRGRLDEAAAALVRARERLAAERVPAQAAAAARELGAVALEQGRTSAAIEALTDAYALADRAGDSAGLGAAANVLGLAHLANGDAVAAVEALRAAAAAHPRSVRPEEHAMAKANLALAYAALGNAPRARLAARQARGVPGAPQPVHAQAEDVLARCGAADDDLVRVLADEPRERWAAVVREELVRWADASADERRADAAAWVETQAGADHAEAWLAALLELPPEAMGAVIASTVDALRDHEPGTVERFRSNVARASARFHTPQLLRLRGAFDHASADAGLTLRWS